MADEGLGPSSHESSRVRLGGYPTRPEGQGMRAVRHERLDDYDDDDDDFVKIDSAGVARGRIAAQLTYFIYSVFADPKPAHQAAVGKRSFFRKLLRLVAAPPEPQRKKGVSMPGRFHGLICFWSFY